MSTRITINPNASSVAVRVQSTLDNLADVCGTVARLRDIAESAAAGADWSAFGALFGVSDVIPQGGGQSAAETLYNSLINLDNFLNHEPASGFLRDVLNRAATR